MKKFGTPIGAGPGGAKGRVGLAGGGMPPFLRSGRLIGRSPVRLAPPPVLPPPPLLPPFLPVFFRPGLSRALDGFCLFVPPADDGFLPPAGGFGLGLGGGGGCVCVWVGVGVCCVWVGAAGGVASLTETIGTLTPGMRICETGVPGAAGTETTIVRPLASVTTSVRCCADAGITAAPRPAPTAAAAAAAITNGRVLIEAIVLLPQGRLTAPRTRQASYQREWGSGARCERLSETATTRARAASVSHRRASPRTREEKRAGDASSSHSPSRHPALIPAQQRRPLPQHQVEVEAPGKSTLRGRPTRVLCGAWITTTRTGRRCPTTTRCAPVCRSRARRRSASSRRTCSRTRW